MDMVVGNALSWQLILSHMGTSQSQIQNSEKGNSQLSQWTAILCALFFINNIFYYHCLQRGKQHFRTLGFLHLAQ